MPPAAEALAGFGRGIRRGAVLAAGILAAGGSLAELPTPAAQAAGPEAQITAVHPLSNVRFGLSGLPLTGPESALLQSPAMQGLRGFNRNIRVVVHESNLRQSRQIIQAAQREVAVMPGDQKLTVSTSISDENVNKATKSKVCGVYEPAAPGQRVRRNRHYNLKTCLKDALSIESRNLRILMDENPHVGVWTAQNEPEDGRQPSNASEGGPLFAAEQYVVAEKDAIAVHHNQVVAAGEFWVFPSEYEEQYYRVLSMMLKGLGLPMPKAEALHPYRGIVCLNAIQQIRAAERDMQKYGLLEPARRGDGLELTEVGIPRNFNLKCVNNRALSNSAHESPDNMSASYVLGMARADILSANTMLMLGRADRKMSFTEDEYDPLQPALKCWSGGPWDDAMYSFVNELGAAQMLPDGTGAPGLPRPELYVFNGLPQPDYFNQLDDKNRAKIRLVARILTPASSLPGSRLGNCAVSAY